MREIPSCTCLRTLRGLVATVAITTCACAIGPRPTVTEAAVQGWDSVLQLEPGTHVIVRFRPDAENPPLRRLPNEEAAPIRFLGDPMIEGSFDGADGSSMSVTTGNRGEARILLARDIVVTIDVIEKAPRDSSNDGTLIGAAAGIGIAAILGVFGADDLVFSGKILYAAGFAAGGALLGRAIDGAHSGKVRHRVYVAPVR